MVVCFFLLGISVTGIVFATHVAILANIVNLVAFPARTPDATKLLKLP